MNMNEYQKVKNYNYSEYCDYLQEKYGIGLCDYMRPSWTKNTKVTRTKEGLYAHHKYEDHTIMLSHPEYAKNNPYEWQLKENIVYCDLLEHLFLHILICENPSVNKNENEAVGVGGVVNHIVPELNDVYSGFVAKQAWQLNCHTAVINDKDVYLELIMRFKYSNENDPLMLRQLYSSKGAEHGVWSKENNLELYREIAQL